MLKSVLRGGRGFTVVALLVLSTARPASGQTPAELQLLALTNQVRASVGAPPLALDGALSLVATTWSTTMSLAGAISHNPLLKSQISGFSRAGENVGVGASLEIVHKALVASPGHYNNIVNPAFSRVGLGVVPSGSAVYLTQVFVQPLGESAAPQAGAPGTSAPATTAATTPRPAKATATTVTTAPSVTAAGAGGAGGRSAARAAAVTGPLPAPEPSPWHVSMMRQLESWDRFLA